MNEIVSTLSLKVENKAIGETFRITPTGTLHLGSEAGNEISVKGEGIAAKHGVFILKEGHLSFVAEATSIVNGKEVVKGSSVLLEIGDVVKIGLCLITVEKAKSEEKSDEAESGFGEIKLGGTTEKKVSPSNEKAEPEPSFKTIRLVGTDNPTYPRMTVDGEIKVDVRDLSTPLGSPSKLTSTKVIFDKDIVNKSRAALKKFDNAGEIAGKAGSKTVVSKRPALGFLKNLFSFSLPKKKLVKVPVTLPRKTVSYRIQNLAGPLPRFWAILWDGIFVYLLSAHIFPLEEWKTFLLMVRNFFTGIIGPILTPIMMKMPVMAKIAAMVEIQVIVEKIWPFILLFIVYRVVCVVIFGVSFSQFVLFMHGSSDAFGNRVGGVFREIVGTLTFPFLVFDLPCVFRRRTFKEYVSKVSLRSSQTGLSLFTGVIILPLLVSMVSSVSLFRDEHSSFRTPVEERDVAEERKLDKDFDDLMGTKQIEFSSSWFKMEGSLYVESNFIFMPSWQINKSENKNLTRPVLVAFDNKRGIDLEFSVSRFIDFRDAVKISSEKNYLFTLSFKALVNSMQKDGVLSSLATTELEQLTNVSMGLSFTQLPKHLFAYGPFVDGFVSFRKWVLEAAGIKKLSRVEFFTLGKQRFMCLSEADPGAEYDEKQVLKIVLIPLSGGSIPIYEITLPFMKMAKVTWQRFLPEFFKDTRFFIGDRESDKVNSTNLTVFSVMDSYMDIKLSVQKRRALNDFIHDYFRNIGKFVLQSKSEALEQKLLEILDRFDTVDTVAKLSNSELTTKLKHLSAAIKDRNLSYFGIK